MNEKEEAKEKVEMIVNIRMSAVTLAYKIKELYDRGISVWIEIIDYLSEKMEESAQK